MKGERGGRERERGRDRAREGRGGRGSMYITSWISYQAHSLQVNIATSDSGPS